MRHHQTRERDAQVDPKRLYCDIALLVTEARLPDSKSGRVEGPHCRQQRLTDERLHQCDVNAAPICSQAAKIRKRTDGLFASALPLSVQAVLIAEQCAGTNDCLPHGVLLETWTIQLHTRRHASSDSVLTPSVLLQAIRSHLGFSQVSAWLIKHVGALPSVKVVYRVALPGEFDSQRDKATPLPPFETHTFPPCAIDRSRILAVEVRSHKRLDEVPLVCVCPICASFPVVDSNDTAKTSVKSSTPVPIISEGCSSSALWQGEGEGSVPSSSCCESASTTVSSPLSPLTPSPMTPSPSFPETVDAASESALSIPSIPSTATCATNPLFSAERFEPRADDGFSPVRFYVSTEDDRFRSTVEQPSRDRSPPRNSWSRRKRLISQKILISDDKDVAAAESGEAELLTELFTPKQQQQQQHGASVSAQAPTTSNDDRTPSQPPRSSSTVAKKIHIAKKAFSSEQRKTRNPGRNLFGRHHFHQATGLPLTSSPAPLKRNQHSFDYDATLGTISGIRSALYYDHDSGSSDSDCGSSHCKSAPASTNLLGNFEESALNGRIKPFGSIDGFLLDLAASGSFCPPHVSLPVTTFFFNVSDDNAPSPYLGHCDLDKIAKKGYHLPKKGTVQATLFNPQGTVVKMFVVRYDLLDMPASCQTFVRQRTFFMPSNGTLNDARIHRSWLRYLIHLRFATSRSGKLYLHTDIRMLFSRKSELDAYNLETGDTGVATAAAMDTFELRSFTEMPKNPKFSPRKCGRRGSSLANEHDDNATAAAAAVSK